MRNEWGAAPLRYASGALYASRTRVRDMPNARWPFANALGASRKLAWAIADSCPQHAQHRDYAGRFADPRYSQYLHKRQAVHRHRTCGLWRCMCRLICQANHGIPARLCLRHRCRRTGCKCARWPFPGALGAPRTLLKGDEIPKGDDVAWASGGPWVRVPKVAQWRGEDFSVAALPHLCLWQWCRRNDKGWLPSLL
jgi:hypothetical protein